MDIGERLLDCLTFRDVSQKKLADMLGVKLQTINSYVKNRIKTPPVDMVERIATALDVNPDYLIGWSEQIEGRGRGSTAPLYYSISSDMTREMLQKLPKEDFQRVNLPTQLSGTGHKYIAIKLDNDAMEPEYKKGDILFIDVTCPKLPNGSDVLISTDYYNATVNRIEVEDNIAELIPLNQKYPSRKIDLNGDNYTIIGPVVSFIRDTIKRPADKEGLTDYIVLEEYDPEE